MTDFLTRFSCLLDVGTAANATRAFDIYTMLMTENSREDPRPSRSCSLFPPNSDRLACGCAILAALTSNW